MNRTDIGKRNTLQGGTLPKFTKVTPYKVKSWNEGHVNGHSRGTLVHRLLGSIAPRSGTLPSSLLWFGIGEGGSDSHKVLEL